LLRNDSKYLIVGVDARPMQIDTVSSPKMPGFVELGISPHSVEAILERMLSNCGWKRLIG
jgi:hypothetical protein